MELAANLLTSSLFCSNFQFISVFCHAIDDFRQESILPSTGVTLFKMDTFCFTAFDLQLMKLRYLPEHNI